MANDLIKQSFWEKKEGTTGMIVGVGILGGIGYGLYKIMPHLADFAHNTFEFVGFSILTAILLYIVLDGGLRSRAVLFYQLLMEKLTYSIIEFDPFGVLREMQKRAQARREEVNRQRVKVKEQSSVINRELQEFQKEQGEVKSNVEWMRRNNKSQELIDDELSKFATLGESITRMGNSFTVIEGFYAQLTRIYNELERYDKKVDWEIDHREREYKAVNATATAMEIMRAVIKGTDGTSQMRDQAMAFLNTNYGEKLGRIEAAMEDSAKFLEQADMRNAQYADKGRKLLDDLNSRDISVGVIANATPTGDVLYKVR